MKMTTLTQQQIKTLTGEKCPICEGIIELGISHICLSCNNTGLPTIEIKKEMVECVCKDWEEKHRKIHYRCNGKGKISKYKVNKEVNYCRTHNVSFEGNAYHTKCDVLKLKIISETEDKQKIQMVK